MSQIGALFSPYLQLFICCKWKIKGPDSAKINLYQNFCLEILNRLKHPTIFNNKSRLILWQLIRNIFPIHRNPEKKKICGFFINNYLLCGEWFMFELIKYTPSDWKGSKANWHKVEMQKWVAQISSYWKTQSETSLIFLVSLGRISDKGKKVILFYKLRHFFSSASAEFIISSSFEGSPIGQRTDPRKFKIYAIFIISSSKFRTLGMKNFCNWTKNKEKSYT